MTSAMNKGLVILVLLLGAAAPSGAQPTQSPVDLGRRAARTQSVVDAYLQTAEMRPGSEAAEQEWQLFVGFARELRDAMRVVAVTSERSPALFRARLEGQRVERDELVDLASRGRLDRFFPLEDDAPRCCPELTAAAAPAERALAVQLEEIWSGFGQAELEEAIKNMTTVYGRFESKLLEGFPAMPWEYLVNFQGGREGPTPHQLIWAHPGIGFEFDHEAAEGTSQVRPVLAVQALGYNFYFLDPASRLHRLRYIGVAALATINTTEGRDRWRPGAAVHFGNVVSVGATHGDGNWIFYVASDRFADEIVGALLRLR